MRCEHCRSEELSYERDALLVATPLRLQGDVLVLESAPRPEPLDEVKVCCRSCGRGQDGVRWEEWRPEQVPAAESVLEAEDALDQIAARLNAPGECQSPDFLEFVSQLLPRTGREVIDSDV